MKINFENDQQIVEKAFDILAEKLDNYTLVRFWKICNFNSQDYAELKEKLFAEETVDSLYQKIKNYEQKREIN